MIRHITRSIDWVMFAAIMPIALGGLATMTSFASPTKIFDRQLIWICIGLVIMFGLSQLDMRILRDSRYIVLAYGISMLLLVLVLVVGKEIKGAKSWFVFGGFFSFQPADIAKLLVIIALAKYFSRRHVEIRRLKVLFISALYVLLPIGLIMLQPDFGSSMVFVALWVGMALVAGISKRHIIMVLGIGLAIFAFAWIGFFKPYQKERILTFANPTLDIRGSGYNAYQSVIAVGSGGFFGKGFGYGTQSRLNFLPEYQTDFIFAAFSEEWGFVGSLVIVVCFAIVLWRIVLHARRAASNFEALFCAGFAILLTGHIMVNIGMNLGVLPVTGIPLPLMSYGGSHLLAEFIGLGIVMSMSRYERAMHPDDLHNEFVGYA